jgi:hypothetical protein
MGVCQQLPHSGGRRSRPEEGTVGAGFGDSAAETSTNRSSRERAKPAMIAPGKGLPAVACKGGVWPRSMSVSVK